MNNKSSLKTAVFLMAGALVAMLVMLAMLPFLTRLLKVEGTLNTSAVVTGVPVPDKPEKMSVTAIYQMEDESKKISAIYIEIFHAGDSEVFYMEIPIDTKVNLSEELYKNLQTYAPELPKYLKLSNMAESFSKEYGLTGCNRILSEVLGISVEKYIRADKDSLQSWMALQAEEKSSMDFFKNYTKWLEESASSMTTEERWCYYESWRRVTGIRMEAAPGEREKDGFLISGKQSKERLQELMVWTKNSDDKEKNE